METAASVIKSALQEILVQASEAPLEADEVQDTITYMNRFMAGLAARGVNVGYTKVSSLSDPITIPDGAIEGLVFSVAKSIAAQFNKQAIVSTIEFREKLRDAMHSMRVLGVNIGPAHYPDTVPVGSGNEGDYTNWGHYYPDTGAQILTEQTGPILLESETDG
jgi:hypothetical protein